jgi:hypothetical protein
MCERVRAVTGTRYHMALTTHAILREAKEKKMMIRQGRRRRSAREKDRHCLSSWSQGF